MPSHALALDWSPDGGRLAFEAAGAIWVVRSRRHRPASRRCGSADPVFALARGQALAEKLPGARLLMLEGAGHGVDRADWPTIARAIVGRTAGHGG
ncbi:MAG TPA: hypothetical protein VFB42_13840 [Gaiellaceae bacterium]|nr:hypothetical protein [Gaiellaceae bacterium]